MELTTVQSMVASLTAGFWEIGRQLGTVALSFLVICHAPKWVWVVSMRNNAYGVCNFTSGILASITILPVTQQLHCLPLSLHCFHCSHCSPLFPLSSFVLHCLHCSLLCSTFYCSTQPSPFQKIMFSHSFISHCFPFITCLALLHYTIV